MSQAAYGAVFGLIQWRSGNIRVVDEQRGLLCSNIKNYQQAQQVFMNLMLNAIEAMKDTGGDITITSQLEQGSKLRIAASDTGVGLPTATADAIFTLLADAAEQPPSRSR